MLTAKRLRRFIALQECVLDALTQGMDPDSDDCGVMMCVVRKSRGVGPLTPADFEVNDELARAHRATGRETADGYRAGIELSIAFAREKLCGLEVPFDG